MKLNKTLQKILKNSECWFLERLDYLGASLIVEMVEGCVSSVSECAFLYPTLHCNIWLSSSSVAALAVLHVTSDACIA